LFTQILLKQPSGIQRWPKHPKAKGIFPIHKMIKKCQPKYSDITSRYLDCITEEMKYN